MDISCKVIIFHELGHIFNGHLKYKYFEVDGKKSSELYMLPGKSNSLLPMYSQTLELNADAFAATQVLAQFTYDSNISYFNKKCPELIKSKDHMYILFFTATVTLFAEMGLANTRNQKVISELNYLPLRTRLDTLIRNSRAAYFYMNKEVSNDSELTATEFLKEVISNVEEYVNLYNIEIGLPKSQFNWENNLEEIDEEHIKHVDRLFQFWGSEVRPKLIKYTYYDLP